MNAIKSWILDNIPNLSQRIETSDELLKFKDWYQGNIAKVYLLSSKTKTPQIYSALTATYKDKIDFAFIIDGTAAAQTFKEIFEINEAPTLLLETTD